MSFSSTDHLAHSLHHPFLHHKSNPSVPFSTRSASTLDQSAPSGITSPQTSVSAPSSHRKFTAFSGSSSSSSTYSASDTSSIVGKYSSYNGHHWGFGEKPDISTVFEEDDRSDGEVEVDFSAARKSSHDPDQRVQREDHLPLGPPIDYPKESEQEAPRGVNGQTQAGGPPTTGHFHRHNTSDISTTTYILRPGRSGTISSQASAHSAKSTKSVHPFASAINRPTSPPPLPRSKLQPPKPKSPHLHEAFTMQQVHLAPVHQVTLSSTDDKDDEEKCPVCCESLSFTFRLPGEKPHVVPECGHALHEVSPQARSDIGDCLLKRTLTGSRNASARYMAISIPTTPVATLAFVEYAANPCAYPTGQATKSQAETVRCSSFYPISDLFPLRTPPLMRRSKSLTVLFV